MGPPGTGKTTQLSKWAEGYVARNYRVAICSLTRTAATEIGNRVGGTIARDGIGTLHSLAYTAIGRPELAEAHMGDWNQMYPYYRITTSSASESGIDRMSDAPGDDILQSYNKLRSCMADRKAWPKQVSGFAEKWESWKSDGGLIDYTDMIEVALRDTDTAPTSPDIIMADEGQDHSQLQWSLLKKWSLRANALILCGDPWQALYEWCGADPDIFNDPSIPDDHRRVLGQSYRVPIDVHRAAMKWVERYLVNYRPIEYLPRQDSGDVRRVAASHKNPEAIVRDAVSDIEDGKSVMICASCGYVLNQTIAVLRKRGIPFCNVWRRQEGRWNPLTPAKGVPLARRVSTFLKPIQKREGSFNFGHNAADHQWSTREVAEWVKPLKARGVVRTGLGTKLASVTSRGDVDPESPCDLPNWFEPETSEFLSRALAGEFDHDVTLAWYRKHLNPQSQKHFEYVSRVACISVDSLTTPPRLYVGSIHSFKGAEADVVYVYPDLSVAAHREWVSPRTRNGVVRQFYVAMTRARHSLRIARPASARSVPIGGCLN